LALTFESESRLSCVGEKVFERCAALSSICIPADVEILGPNWFLGCGSSSTIIFEAGRTFRALAPACFCDQFAHLPLFKLPHGDILHSRLCGELAVPVSVKGAEME
jgi:hypothetical protein